MSTLEQKKIGFTLIEVIIAIGVGAGIFLLSAQLIEIINKSIAGNQKLNNFLSEKTTLDSALQFYFKKAQSINFTQQPGIRSEQGFLISKQGAVILQADLRACNTFQPAKSALNISQIKILCCDAGLRLVGSTSSCTQGSGVSIEIIQAGRSQRFCFSDYSEMNIVSIGSDLNHGSDFLRIDIKSSIGALGAGGKFIKGTEKSLQLVVSAQNTLKARSLECQESIKKSF